MHLTKPSRTVEAVEAEQLQKRDQQNLSKSTNQADKRSAAETLTRTQQNHDRARRRRVRWKRTVTHSVM